MALNNKSAEARRRSVLNSASATTNARKMFDHCLNRNEAIDAPKVAADRFCATPGYITDGVNARDKER